MPSNHAVQNAVEYIEQNLAGELNLDTVAASVGYSKFHLNRLFSEQVGCTIHKYIQGRRLTNAAAQLVCGGRPIIDIALEAGYGSQQAFTYAFQKMYGITPLSYRLAGQFAPRQARFGAGRAA